MDYYDILDVSFTDDTTTIRKHYYRLAKQYHPDKCKDTDKNDKNNKTEAFKTLSEAYSTLSNPKKRFIYDVNRFSVRLKLDLHISDDYPEEDLDIISTYYKNLCSSVECKLFYRLIQSLPRFKDTQKNQKNQKNQLNQQVGHKPKLIECHDLQEDFTVHLIRNLVDVYRNICKEIIVIIESNIYHLFITHSDYTLTFPGQSYTLTIHITTSTTSEQPSG